MKISRCLIPAVVMTGLMVGVEGRADAAFVSLTPSDGLLLTYRAFSLTPEYRSDTSRLEVADVLARRFGPLDTYKIIPIIKFDLSSIPADARVISASLTFDLQNYLSFLNTPANSISITTGGSPSTTISVPTTPAPGPSGIFTSLAGTASHSVEVPSNLGYGPYTILPRQSLDQTELLREALGTAPGFAAMFSISGTLAHFSIGTPRLEVTFEPAAVPEPSSLALCGVAGVAGLGVWARRRRLATVR